MRKQIYLVIASVLMLLSSCSKKMGEVSSDYFSTNPSVLEVVGNKVPVTINGKFPAKYFNKKSVVTVTPFLAFDGGEVYGESMTFQGEKVEGNNKTIFYKEGGLFEMKTSFDYKDAMKKSELYLKFLVRKGNKEYELPRVKIADGIIATAKIASAKATTAAIAPDKFQRIIKEAKEANIRFLIQRTEVRASELRNASVKALKERLGEAQKAANQKVANVEISSYASPDGGLDLNEKLASKRENNSTKVINKMLKRAKVEAPVEGKFTAEDWDGFKELVEKSKIQDKEIILRVLSMYNDPEEREREIKNISVAYKSLTDEILPQLRRSKLKLTVEIIGKSDDEIIQLAKYTPAKLTVEEILYAATLMDSDNEKVEIYNKTAKAFPSDYRAINNLGVINYQAGNYDKAVTYFEQAARINSDAKEVNMNKALFAMMNNNTDEAKVLISKATGTPELNDAMGLYYLQTGEYTKAVAAFKGVKNNNAALANIMTKNYNAAKTILNDIQKPNATTSYLMAVIGARTNNSSLVMESLKAAASRDITVARQALTDIEFAKYATNQAFLKIVK